LILNPAIENPLSGTWAKGNENFVLAAFPSSESVGATCFYLFVDFIVASQQQKGESFSIPPVGRFFNLFIDGMSGSSESTK